MSDCSRSEISCSICLQLRDGFRMAPWRQAVTTTGCCRPVWRCLASLVWFSLFGSSHCVQFCIVIDTHHGVAGCSMWMGSFVFFLLILGLRLTRFTLMVPWNVFNFWMSHLSLLAEKCLLHLENMLLANPKVDVVCGGSFCQYFALLHTLPTTDWPSGSPKLSYRTPVWLNLL